MWSFCHRLPDVKHKFTLVSILLCLINLPFSISQLTGGSDRTQQELNFLTWASGIRIAYCQDMSIVELIDPFKEAVAKMVNRHCRNATACRLKKSVTFSKHQVVLMDTYPRRENRALNFRFFVVLPHDAIPMDRRLDKPLIPLRVMSDILQSQITELTHILGWQVLSYERYPRFDTMTTFMNRALIPIAIVAALCMLFLAYWSSTITSGSSIYSGDGWMVSGSTGGKNAALRRTLEIIEEQKFRFAQYDLAVKEHGMRMNEPPTSAVVVYKSNSRVQGVSAPPRSLATSIPAHGAVALHATPLPKKMMSERQSSKSSSTPSTSTPKSSETSSVNMAHIRGLAKKGNEEEDFEAMDVVPEMVIMHTRNSSIETADTPAGSRRVSIQGHRRQSRRMSVSDEFKRKKSGGFSGGVIAPKRANWKAGSLMFSRFANKK